MALWCNFTYDMLSLENELSRAPHSQHAKTAQAQKRATEPPKLPVLLKPEPAAAGVAKGKGGQPTMPTFEVEEVNGQLVLLPTDGSSARKNPFANERREVRRIIELFISIPIILFPMFHSIPQKEDESKKSSSENNRQPKQVKSSSSFGDHFTPNLCGAYSAMLHVFRMLTPHERFVAARVCRMWRDLAYHNSLWSSISLKVRLR